MRRTCHTRMIAKPATLGTVPTVIRWVFVLGMGAACAANPSRPDAATPRPPPDAAAPEPPLESLYRGIVSERLSQGFAIESGTWIRIENGVEPARLRRRVTPEYTDEALDRKIEGTVILEVVILQSGRVGPVRINRSLDAGLDAKAVAAVREWTFQPARFQGIAVDVLVEIEIEFRLL